MPVYTTEEQKDLSIKEGEHVRATLKEIKEKEIKWTIKSGPDAGKPASAVRLVWWWELASERFTKDDATQRMLKGECEARITNHPNNKFREWAQALLQREISLGTPVDTEDLVGFQADLTVKHRADKNDPSRVYEEVDTVVGIANYEEPPF